MRRAPVAGEWTWDDHPVYGRGRGVIKDEARSLSCGEHMVITSAARNDPISPEAYLLIPWMADVLNKARLDAQKVKRPA